MGIAFNKDKMDAACDVWVLVTRKARTKDKIHFYVGCDVESNEDMLRIMKENKQVFVTLFTLDRVAQYLDFAVNGTAGAMKDNNETLWGRNMVALQKVGCTGTEVIKNWFLGLIDNCVGAVEADLGQEVTYPDDLLVDWEEWLPGAVWEYVDEDGGSFTPLVEGSEYEDDEEEDAEEESEENGEEEE